MEIIVALVVLAVLGFWAWNANKKPNTDEKHPLDIVNDNAVAKQEAAPYKIETPAPVVQEVPPPAPVVQEVPPPAPAPITEEKPAKKKPAAKKVVAKKATTTAKSSKKKAA